VDSLLPTHLRFGTRFGARFGWRLCEDKNDLTPLSNKKRYLPLPSPTRTHSLPHSSLLLKLSTSNPIFLLLSLLSLSTKKTKHHSLFHIQTSNQTHSNGNWKSRKHQCQRNQTKEQENHGMHNLSLNS